MQVSCIWSMCSSYNPPSCEHFRQSVAPAVCKRVKAAVVQELSAALATDGWTFRATQSHLTMTAYYITPRMGNEKSGPANSPHLWTTYKHMSGRETKGGSIGVEIGEAREKYCTQKRQMLQMQSVKLIHMCTAVSQVSRLMATVRKVVIFFPLQHNCRVYFGDKQVMLNVPNWWRYFRSQRN